jgi:3-oxoacyl-[acyl-carrier-protein] synthase-3
MRTENIYLAGIGTCLPPRVTTAEAVERGWYDEQARHDSGFESIAVANGTPAPDLAVEAAKVALRRSGRSPDDISALLHCTTHHQGPDGWSAPHYVLRETLDRPIFAAEVRQGCVGAILGLQLAVHRLVADPGSDAVLLTSADNFSTPLVDRWRASSLFVLADGGSSLVIARGSGFARVLAIGAVSNPGMEALHRGGEEMFPPGITVGRELDFDSRTAYWRQQWARGEATPIGNPGECVAAVVEQVLAEAQVPLEKVTRVCHVGFARGPLEGVYFAPLGLDPSLGVFEYSRRTGHVGASDPLIGLERLWTNRDVVPGDHVLLIANAPGIEAGCALVEVVEPYRGDADGGGTGGVGLPSQDGGE